MKSLCLSAMTGHEPSPWLVIDAPNLNMMSPYYILFSVVLGLVLAIPLNTSIVTVNLETIRKKGKLSPSDAIFLAKAIVNVLLQGLMTLQGTIIALNVKILFIPEVYSLVMVSAYFLTYYGFWLTAWLSIHYWTSITNLSSGLFIWIKRVVSHFLGQILVLTALGMLPVSLPSIWTFSMKSNVQSLENITDGASAADVYYTIKSAYFVPMTFLGSVLPFSLSLLCLLLTVSFLVRHIWRVKNNDSGSTRPNLQAHVTALRTIFYLLLMFSFFFIHQLLLPIRKPKMSSELGDMVRWTMGILSPSVDAAIIFQASNRLRRVLLRTFWTRRGRNTET